MKKGVKKGVKHGKTDWNKLRNMKETAIVSAAHADSDSPLLSDVQLRKFKRVYAPETIDVKKIRITLNLSQEEFAHYFGVSKRTIQEWEQGRRIPTSTARNFLRVVEREPQAVQRALMNKDKAA